MQSNFHDIGVILFVIIAALAALVFIGVVSWIILKILRTDVKKVFKATKGAIIISVISIFIAAVSWLLNFGWLRFIATIMMIPFIHAVIFFLTNFITVAYSEKIAGIKRLNMFFIITYLVGYLFLADFGDYGSMYFFFGLIHSDEWSHFASSISTFSFFAHIALFVLQIVKIGKLKKGHIKTLTDEAGENN